MDPEFSFGEWIRRRRKYLGLTQEMLAEQVGYSAAMMRKIENDERRPSARGTALLAEALEIPPDQLDTFLKVARQERAVDRLGSAVPDELFPWESASRPQTNLPVPATLFVGREAELLALSRLIADPACRLVTLVGLAGIGKTRLAIQAAHGLLDRFAHGVFFVSLAPLSSPKMIAAAIAAAIAATIANAIGLQLHGAAEPQEQLLRYLQGKRMLLVLDNFEHLIQGENLVAEIVRTTPGVQLLVTSRERLNLQGEWLFEVEGLPYPATLDERGLENVEGYSAVQLFLQGALRVNPHFRLAEENRESVVRICQMTEGCPLAVELAAAWVRVLSCRVIAEEIERNLDFLKASAMDIPERHKSVRAALDHSYKLLSEQEQAVLRQLSVFRGGFSRDAAQKVAGAGLEDIASLLDKSLLKRGGEERYDLHELVRQYAAAHLESDPQELAQAHDRHSRYYVERSEQWGNAIRGPRQIDILAEMDAEIDNMRLAWRWIVSHRQFEEIRKSMESLRNFYEVRARFQEGTELFHEAVTALETAALETAALETAGETEAERADERDVVLGQLLVREGYFQVLQGHYEQASELLPRSLALHRASSDRLALADTLAVLAYMHSRQGEFTKARQLADESLDLHRALGNQIGKAFCLRTLVNSCLAVGDYEEAYAFSKESLAICREILEDPHGTAICLTTLSAAARHLGKLTEARQWAEEGVQISKTLNDRWVLAQTLRQLGVIHMEMGEHGQAEELIRQSIAHTRDTGDRMLLGSALISLGAVERELGAQARSNQCFLQALHSAVETKTITVALQALTEISVSAMNAGEKEPALKLAIYALRHPSLNARLKARLDEIYAELAAQLTSQQVAEIEERVRARPLDSVLQELLAERMEV